MLSMPPPKAARPQGVAGILATIAIFALTNAIHAAGGTGDAPPALEYKVKAGYLYNFGRFIEWPTNTFSSSNAPFVIAVLDAGEARPILESLMAGKILEGHSVQVKAATPQVLADHPHILMVTRAAGKSPEDIRALLKSAPVLVVGETDEFVERGGTVGFVWEGDSIRLTLNLDCAAECGLKVSAKLATVARVIRNKRPD